MKQNEYIVTYVNGNIDRIRTYYDLMQIMINAPIKPSYIEADIIYSLSGKDVSYASVIMLNNVCKIEEAKIR